MEKKTLTPVVVVYKATDIKTGDFVAGNHCFGVDKLPLTVSQWAAIKEELCKKKGVREVIFLNIIPLRLEEVQEDE